VTYFVNSGSEANDLAVMMARLYSGNHDIIALHNAYHGGTSSAQALTSHHTWKFPLHQSDGVHHVGYDDPSDIEKTIRFSTPGSLAAFIAEPIQGVGGVTGANPNYFQRAYEITREHGGLCISDEVQTGFGRTGDFYWGFERFGVVPDIVTVAKGLGNGVPLAAVTTRREVAETLRERLHFNTFGGNPVSMAQGLAVLDVIEEEGLQENARVVGGHFKAGLQELMTRHDLISDVRGYGLMLGVELSHDGEPATTQAAEFLERARQLGVLIGKGGLYGNVLRIKPPMCIHRDDVDFALKTFDQALTDL